MSKLPLLRLLLPLSLHDTNCGQDKDGTRGIYSRNTHSAVLCHRPSSRLQKRKCEKNSQRRGQWKILQVGVKTFRPLRATPFLVEDNSALHALQLCRHSLLSLSLSQGGKKRRQQTFIGLLSRLGGVKSTRLQRRRRAGARATNDVQRNIKFHKMEMEIFLVAARGLSD